MSSLISQVNSSITALGPLRAFIGKYETVTNYLSAIITVNTDTDCELIVFQSIDKINSVSTSYNTVANTPFTQIVLLQSPYFYITLRNTNPSVAQTFLNLETIYRPTQVVAPAGVGSNVNIVSQSAGLALNSTLTTINSTLTTINQTLKGKASTTLWNAATVENADVSAVASTVYATRVLSIFGTSSQPATLTLQLSNDGTNFFSTQSTINVDGNFGFSLPCAFVSFRLVASEISTTSTISAFSTYA